MATLEQVTSAKALIRARLGRPAWLRGVGIAHGADDGYFLRIYVSELTPETLEALPTTVGDVGDVTIQVEAIGDIKALSSQ